VPSSEYVFGAICGFKPTGLLGVVGWDNSGTPPGAYTVTVYAFTESNSGNGSNSTADANVVIPVTVN